MKQIIPDNYLEAYRLIGSGIAKLLTCLWRTFTICSTDLARCFIKHPLALLLILATLGYSFYSMAEARAERDHLAQHSYHLEQKIDSLKLIINK